MVMIFKADDWRQKFQEKCWLLTIFGDHCVGHSDRASHFDFQLEFAQLVVELDVGLQPVGSLDGGDLGGGGGGALHPPPPVCRFLTESSQAEDLTTCIWIVPQHLLLWQLNLFGSPPPPPALTDPRVSQPRPFLTLRVQKVTVLITEVALRPELEDALHLFVRWHSRLLGQGKLQKSDC